MFSEQVANSAETAHRFAIEWTRFAERLRQREVPGFAQAEFEAAIEFYAQRFSTEAEWDSYSSEEEEEEEQ